jgi:hypothetical protein
MKNDPHGEDEKNQASKYLRRIDDTYVFDQASGVYKSKPNDAEYKGRKNLREELFSQPIVVNVARLLYRSLDVR